MTTTEFQASLERLTASRAALLEYEDLALSLAACPHAGAGKGVLLAFKEQLHATRLLVLEVGERCRPVVQSQRGGWGHE